jgi:hypothetical protein
MLRISGCGRGRISWRVGKGLGCLVRISFPLTMAITVSPSKSRSIPEGVKLLLWWVLV